jgi:hypothetical protein
MNLHNIIPSFSNSHLYQKSVLTAFDYPKSLFSHTIFVLLIIITLLQVSDPKHHETLSLFAVWCIRAKDCTIYSYNKMRMLSREASPSYA